MVRQSFIGTGEDNPTQNWLYELPADNEPVVRGQWDYDPEFRPVTSVSPCSDDGKTIYALYASEAAVTQDQAPPGLTLVHLNTVDGSRTQTQLDMPGYTWSTHRSSLSLLGGRLYWITQDGDVLSVPLDGSSTVRKEWTLPNGSDRIMVSVRGETVSVLNYRDHAVFARHDLATGRRLGDDIELPWLDDIQGQQTQSVSTVYSIADVASVR